MSSENEDAAQLLLAKQNPETGAKLLRQLSRAQLQLWQDIGRKGLTLSDLSIRHVGRDMLKEVRFLEERGVVIVETLAEDQAREAFSARGQTSGPPPEDEEDRRIRRPSAGPRNRVKRSTAAVEKSNLEQGRKRTPSKAAPVDEANEETAKAKPVAAKRQRRRSTAAIEMPTRNPKAKRKQSPTAPAHTEALAEDKTKEATPAAAKRTRRPTAAIEKPVKKSRRKQAPTEAIPPKETEAETAEATPAAARKRPQRPTAAIEKPVRQRKKKRKPSVAPPSIGFGEPPAEPGGQEAPMATSALERWAEKAPNTMKPELELPPLGLESVDDWGARGTKAETKPAMPNPLHGRSKAGSDQAPRAASSADAFESMALHGDAPEQPPSSSNSMALQGDPTEQVSTRPDIRGLQGDPTEQLSIRPDPMAQAGDLPKSLPTGSGAMELEVVRLTLEEEALMKLEVDLSIEEKRRVIDVARAVKSGDICGLLGLPSTADRKQIKRAYFTLSQELHPDQYFGRKLGGFKPLLEQAFTSLAQFVKALNDKRTSLPNSFQSSNQSRRKSQRFHLSLRAQVQCDSWNNPEWTTTQDISSGGAFLITDVEAVLGEPIRLNVESPNGTIGIVGKVVSMREADQARRERRNSGLGIQFENAAKLDADRLKDLLEEAKSKAPAFTGSIPIKSLEAQRLASSSKAIHREKHIIGIDLGTTNTAVSVVIDNRVQIVPWPDGTYSAPSVVSFPERGRCVVGHEAQEHLLSNPRQVISSAKRLIGRQIEDPEIASYLADARFKHHKGPDGTVIAELQGEDYAIPQICSYLFSAAKHAAEKALGAQPTKAVLTMPVSYDESQIKAMRSAARLAQLDVVEIIQEPCAAAIANQGQKDFKGIVGVYDFGGGTFDFSLVEAGTGDLRVLASTGDSWLGGDDFDLAIADAAANMFWKAEGTDLRQKLVEWQHLIYACEQAKRDLSKETHAQVVVPDVARNAQGPVDLRINLAREKVELLWAEPIRRSIDTCKQALSLAGVSMTQLSAIYMSGGTSYIPAIRRSLMKSFGVPVHLGLAPEHAVCAGAGIRAAILQGS